jgi:hypothetical protein
MAEVDNRITIPKALYDLIERDVVDLYTELGLSVPIEPAEVAERLGCDVKRLSDLRSSVDDLDALRLEPDGSINEGFSFRDPNSGRYIIVVNDIDIRTIERQEFTIMHEIGHIRMGHKHDSPLAEAIANYYAGYTLVPSPLYKIHECSDVLDIAIKFGVSMECAGVCFKRIQNWINICGYKDYEIRLLEYYDHILKGGG